jgi:membrane-bound lytic murein transglycosylase B
VNPCLKSRVDKFPLCQSLGTDMKKSEQITTVLIRLLLLPVTLLLLTSSVMAQDVPEDFVAWLSQLHEDARAVGISQQTLDLALSQIEAPLSRVIESDRNQPELRTTLQNYLANRVTPQRIASGRKMLKRYPTWLGRVEHQFRVQRRFLVALWGIESNYGRHTGELPVIPALVTLAYDQRRAAYFRRELLEALKILDDGQVSMSRMKGSWAGAMGPFQFMPSTYRSYAVDADRDGRINIWGSVPDALASAAHYLAKVGWQDDQTWGRPVKLPKNFAVDLAGLDKRQPLSRWQAHGVRRMNGRALPRRELQASLILPDGPSGPAYLVYDNFRVLLQWNRSVSFAIAVGTLADRLAGREF